ncbi:MAG: hypothetical protein PHW31_02430 [Candidatus Pacebacteria bacterium]|nr:hypothetical protein [Candidatus Paceibacterota bacterium]
MKELDLGVKWFNVDFYPKTYVCRAARYEDGVLPRLREKKITLFTPWGPRYSWEKRGTVIHVEDKEIEVLEFLAKIFSEMKKNMPNKDFRWIFFGADLYGTKVNNLPNEMVDNYFAGLAKWLPQILPEAELKLWSSFNDIAENYRQKVATDFRKYVSPNLLLAASKTANAMGRDSDPKNYIIERIAEAMLIEETLHPIKVSCVGRHKDEHVDWQLPRIYLLPENLWAPWM